jgi:hypothetical protein
MNSRIKNRSKSLRTLFASKKTKEKSPDMTGKLKILKHTLNEIIETHREEDGDGFQVNLAGWFNISDGKTYMTLELSPLYRPTVQRSKKDMTVEEFRDKISNKRD